MKRVILVIILLLLFALIVKGYYYFNYATTNYEEYDYENITVEINDKVGKFGYKDISFNLDFMPLNEKSEAEDGLVIYSYNDMKVRVYSSDSTVLVDKLLEMVKQVKERDFERITDYLDKYNVENDIDLMEHFITSNYQSYNFLTSIKKLREASLFNKYLIGPNDKQKILILDGYISGKVIMLKNDNIISILSLEFLYNNEIYSITISDCEFDKEDVIEFINTIKLD